MEISVDVTDVGQQQRTREDSATQPMMDAGWPSFAMLLSMIQVYCFWLNVPVYKTVDIW